MGRAEAHYTGKDHVPVPTQEDRIAALERKVALLELLRSQDERKAEEALPPAQARTMKEINENFTILLGVTSSQGRDIKVIKADTSSIKELCWLLRISVPKRRIEDSFISLLLAKRLRWRSTRPGPSCLSRCKTLSTHLMGRCPAASRTLSAISLM